MQLVLPFEHMAKAAQYMEPVSYTHLYFWDVDGNKFIDYMCAYGPNVLGYNDPDVDAAALEQAKKCNCTTSPSYKAVEFAELLVDTVNCADWAFFAKNGNDVTTAAIMTARAHTHRKKIIFINGFYHGISPWTQKVDYPEMCIRDSTSSLISFASSGS